MKRQRTVVFAIAAQGELLDVAKSALASMANLLCLSQQPAEGLPRLGICAIVNQPTTGKASVKVNLPLDVSMQSQLPLGLATYNAFIAP